MRPGCLPQQIRQSLTLILLAGGFAYCWQAAGLKSIDRYQIAAVILALIVAVIPSVQRGRHPDQPNASIPPWPHAAGRSLWPLAFLVAIYLLLLAARNSDSLFLKINDEHAYMIQARMLATGRLWMPAYPPAIVPFFDALALINDRVYAPMYFPGTALATVPFVWLHLPFWIMPLLAASASAGMLYSLSRSCSILYGDSSPCFCSSPSKYSQTHRRFCCPKCHSSSPSCSFFSAWFSFRRRPKWVPALLIGVAGGFAAITRPLDAVCFACPSAWQSSVQLRRKPAQAAARTAWIIRPRRFAFLGSLADSKYRRHRTLERIRRSAITTTKTSPLRRWDFIESIRNHIPAQMSLPKQQWLHDWVLPSFQTPYVRSTPFEAGSAADCRNCSTPRSQSADSHPSPPGAPVPARHAAGSLWPRRWPSSSSAMRSIFFSSNITS